MKIKPRTIRWLLSGALLLAAGCGRQARDPYRPAPERKVSRRQVFRATEARVSGRPRLPEGPVVTEEINDGKDLLIVIDGKRYVLPIRQGIPGTELGSTVSGR